MSKARRAKLDEMVQEFDRELGRRRAAEEEERRRAADLLRKVRAQNERKSADSLGLDKASIRKFTAVAKREGAVLREEARKFASSYTQEELSRLEHEEAVTRMLTSRPPENLSRTVPSVLYHPFPAPPSPPAPEEGPLFYQLFPPALSIDAPAGKTRFSDLASASLWLCSEAKVQGGPLGWEASVEPAWDFPAVRFAFTPPVNGTLYVGAEVHLNVGAWVTAVDHWYSNTFARARVFLGCDLFQYTYSAGARITVLDEQHEDSAYIHFMSETYYPTASLASCVGDTPVLIDVIAALQTIAISDGADAEICPFSMCVRRLAVWLIPFPRVDVPY